MDTIGFYCEFFCLSFLRIVLLSTSAAQAVSNNNTMRNHYSGIYTILIKKLNFFLVLTVFSLWLCT